MVDSSPRNLLRVQPRVERNKMRLSSMGHSYELGLRHTLWGQSPSASNPQPSRHVLIITARLNPSSLLYNPGPPFWKSL